MRACWPESASIAWPRRAARWRGSAIGRGRKCAPGPWTAA